MNPRSILPALLGLVAAVAVHAGVLDEPAAKPVTVRTEIDRGYSAAKSAASKIEDPTDLSAAIDKVLADDKQGQKDTDAFKLGVWFGAWRSYWKILNDGLVLDGQGKITQVQTDIIVMMADLSHQKFRFAYQDCGLTDRQVQEALGTAYDPANDEPAFTNALKTKNFKGSMPPEQMPWK